MTDNELIAEFMGHTKDPEYNYWVHAAAEKSTNYRYEFRIYKFTYHLSWDELMPVVEKIATLKPENTKYVDFDIQAGGVCGWIAWQKNIPGDQNQPQGYYDSDTYPTTIERTYHAVVDFIKWYKETTDQTVQ